MQAPHWRSYVLVCMASHVFYNYYHPCPCLIVKKYDHARWRRDTGGALYCALSCALGALIYALYCAPPRATALIYALGALYCVRSASRADGQVCYQSVSS
jgi:hypothetical protein